MQHKNRVIGMVAITVAVGLTLGTVVIASGSGFSHKRGSDAGGDQIRVLPTSVQAQTAQPRRTTRQAALITACQNKKTGVLAVKPKCSKKEITVSWNVAGQAGAAGANGAAGAAGAAGPAGSAGSNATVSFYSTTWTTPITVSPDQITSPLGVVCRAGDSAISGGVYAEGAGAAWGYLQSSYADEADDTQWVFMYGSDSPAAPLGGDLSVQFQVICSDN